MTRPGSIAGEQEYRHDRELIEAAAITPAGAVPEAL
jgi:hypothetical protein